MSNDNPLLERGRIKIYGRTTNGVNYYDVVDGRDRKHPYQASLEVAHSGAKLTPKQVWEMMTGNAVEIDAVGTKGAYKAFLFLRGIGEQPKQKDGKTFINRFVNLGRALPVIKKSTGELVGFNLRHPDAKEKGDNRSVCVFLNYGKKDNPVTLEDPGQAYRLLAGDPVVINGRGTLTLDKIAEEPREGGGVNYTAKVNIEWGPSQASRFTFADDGEESDAPTAATRVAEGAGDDVGGESADDDDPFAPSEPPSRRQLAA